MTARLMVCQNSLRVERAILGFIVCLSNVYALISVMTPCAFRVKFPASW